MKFQITHEFLAYMLACAVQALLEPPVSAQAQAIRYRWQLKISTHAPGTPAAAGVMRGQEKTYARVLNLALTSSSIADGAYCAQR